jgi:hypothetical protein
MYRSLFFCLFFILSTTACDLITTFELDTSFSLNYKQFALNPPENLRIRFDEVVNDSRCPDNTDCILAGNAKVKLTVFNDFSNETITLNTNKESNNQKVFGYFIYLKDLTPSNSNTALLTQKDYRIALMISKSPRQCVTNTDCILSGTAQKQYCRKNKGDCDGIGQCITHPVVCTFEFRPVCGCDNNTYNNPCIAMVYGTNIAYEGKCEE